MKPIAWIVIIVSLVSAIIAAVTAYSPKLARVEEYTASLPSPSTEQPSATTSPKPDSAGATEGDAKSPLLTLNAPAGVLVTEGARQPVAPKGTVLTPQRIDELQSAGVRRVRVKEFKPTLWSEWWIFAAGCVGMLAGALVIRRETARELASVRADADASAGPDAILASVRAEVNGLRSKLAETKLLEQREQMVLSILGRIIAEDIPAFIAARPGLVSRLGLAGYAQLMDRFAAGERQLNRAWSAAADGYEQEATDCLANAAVLLEESEQKMR